MLSLKDQVLVSIVLFILINTQTAVAFYTAPSYNTTKSLIASFEGEGIPPQEDFSLGESVASGNLGEGTLPLENPVPSGENTSWEKTASPKSNEPIRNGFTCNLSEMSDEDAYNFLKLLRDGFLGSEYSSGAFPEKAREKLENPTVIIPINKEKGVAQKVELADEKFDANEAQHIMNDWIQGPFAYGLVLTDTLRVGRCVGLADKNIPCPLEGKQLSLRNSGTGFKSDFKPISQFFKDAFSGAKGFAGTAGERIAGAFTGKDYNFVNKPQDEWTDQDYKKMRKAMGLPENAQESLKEYAASSDLNETNVHTMTRTIQKMVANSILAQDFYAYSQTTCNTSDCIINVYSLFDKYYNNWFSVDMVLSTSMPTLLSRARKLFMNMGRRGNFPWHFSDSTLAQMLRRKIYKPDGYFYKRLTKRMWHRAETFPEVGKLRYELMETKGWQNGMLLTKSRPFRDKLENEWMSQGGWFDKITDGRIQKEMYQFSEDVRKWQKVHQALYRDARDQYMKAYRAGLGTPQEVAGRIEFGRKIANLMTNSENAIHLDLPEWFSRDGSARLFYYGVKPQGSDASRWLAHDSIDIYDVLKKFEADGHFGGAWAKGKSGFAGYESTGKNLNLYAFDPRAKQVGEVTGSELRDHFTQFTDLFVKTDPGDVMPVKDTTLPYVSNVMTGKKPTYVGAIAKAREMSPDEFAQRLVNNHRLGGIFDWYGPDNSDKLVHALQAKGFMKRRYTSLLDRAMMNQHQLLTNYFKPGKGPIKWTAYFNTYWWAKRGFGNKAFSAYMLPDSWREIRWPLGSDALYNDAFIDFFAHAGSDQGDMFRRMLNYMPYEWLGSQALSNYKPAKRLYERFTGNSMRNKVENLAFYGTTQQECSGCGVSLDSARNFQQYSAFFFVNDIFKSYMVEDIVSDEAREKGTTLISFAHHTNLEGKDTSAGGSGTINLREAIAEKKTCNEAVAEASMGLYPKNSPLFKPSTFGGVLAFGESVLYASAFWAGMFGTLLQQIAIAPKLQDCVDVDEGYYTHIFAPAKEEEKTEAGAQVLSTDKAMNMAEGFSGQLLGMFKSDTNSYTSKAAKELDSKVKNFFESTKQNDIVQATVETHGYSSGKLSGEQLFSFWFKGETSPDEYKTSGVKKIASKDGNKSVVVDFKNGRVYVVDQNGNISLLTDNNLATASSSTNTRIPAEEFGKKFTAIGLPEKGQLLFEMNIKGDLIVKVPDVIDCLLRGIEYQSGIEAKSTGSSYNLTPVFGKVQSIVTDSHPAIRAWSEDNKIVAEGTPRLSVEGENAMVKMYTDRNTYLWKPDSNKFVGLFKSIQFKNGVILYKPDSHELVVWLKRHELGQLSSDDVANARLKESHIINPETDCPEPAVDLEVLPSQSSGTTAFKVNAFNKALQNVGPFTVLETPTRRFVFFSRYEDDGKCTGTECCKQYFRVINKKTGEVYEAPIESMAVTPNGIKIKDGNGKEHNIGFNAKNGVPTITYNNYPPEPLTSAQGPNGSFWYDPEKGIWNAENAQLLPLLEAFRNGSLTQVGPGGNVVTKPGDNIMNINTGVGEGGIFNLPSLPENPVEIVLYFLALVIASYALVYRKKFCLKQ